MRRVQVQGSKPNRAEANAAPTSSIDLVKVTPQLYPNQFPNPGWGGGLRKTATRSDLPRADERQPLALIVKPYRWFVSTPIRPLVAGLLALAFALRLWFLPEARFTGDEALFYENATRAAWGEWFPWIGPLVTDGPLHHPGGTFFLLMALPLTITRSPLGPMALIALMNVLAYGLLYCIFARLWSVRVGLLMLGLMLFSPWSFFYSDRIWNSNLVLPLAAIFLWALFHVLSRPRARHLFWVLWALVLMPQFHLSVVLLVALGGALLLLYRPPLHWWSGLMGLLAGLVFYLPYLVMELKTGFANTRLLWTGASGESEGAGAALDSLMGFLVLPSAEMSYFAARGFWFPHDLLDYYVRGPGLAGLAEFLGGGIIGALLVALVLFSLALVMTGLALALATSCGALLRGRRLEPLSAALLLSLAIIPATFLLSGKPFFPHYIYPLYPLAFVAPLHALRPLTTHRAGFPAAVGLVALVALAEVTITARYYREVDAPIGVASSTEVVRAIHEVGDELGHFGPVSISFDIEKSRLSPQPLLRLARRRFVRPIQTHPRAELAYRIFSRARWEQFQSLPPHQRRIAAAPVGGSRELEHVVLAWSHR